MKNKILKNKWLILGLTFLATICFFFSTFFYIKSDKKVKAASEYCLTINFDSHIKSVSYGSVVWSSSGEYHSFMNGNSARFNVSFDDGYCLDLAMSSNPGSFSVLADEPTSFVVVDLVSPSGTITLSSKLIPSEFDLEVHCYDCTSSLPEKIEDTVTGVITPNRFYALPEAVTVTGASYIYDNKTGEITIYDPTNTVTVEAEGYFSKYSSKTKIDIPLGYRKLTSSDYGRPCSDFDWYIDMSYQLDGYYDPIVPGQPSLHEKGYTPVFTFPDILCTYGVPSDSPSPLSYPENRDYIYMGLFDSEYTVMLFGYSTELNSTFWYSSIVPEVIKSLSIDDSLITSHNFSGNMYGHPEWYSNSLLNHSNWLYVKDKSIDIEDIEESSIAVLDNREVLLTSSDYPFDLNDYSLDVVQVCEAEDRSLRLLVYQPSADTYGLEAKKINMKYYPNDDFSLYGYRLYNLTKISSNGVFYEYVVNDFICLITGIRHYDISAIYRNLNADIDEQADLGQTINTKAYDVAKCWEVKNVDDEKQYSMKYMEVITIENPFVGFVRYDSGNYFAFGRYDNALDSHFIAFSTDKPIDKLVDAEVFFKRQSCRCYGYENNLTFEAGELVDSYVKCSAENGYSFSSLGFFGQEKYTYNWQRIETTDTFKSGLIDGAKLSSGLLLDVNGRNIYCEGVPEALNQTQWVLRFFESGYSYSRVSNAVFPGMFHIDESKTNVSEETILSLTYIYDGETYSLGAVMDQMTENEDPAVVSGTETVISDNLKNRFKGKAFESGCQSFKSILTIVLGLAFILFLLWFISWIYRLIRSIFKNFNKKK